MIGEEKMNRGVVGMAIYVLSLGFALSFMSLFRYVT